MKKLEKYSHAIANNARLGGWLARDPQVVDIWLEGLRAKVALQPRPLIEPIQELREMVYNDPNLYASVQGMFAEAHYLRKRTPLPWEAEPLVFEEFLILLNEIMFTAPEAYQTGHGEEQEAAGMIGFPINALLDWPMATNFGYEVFSNSLINQQFKKILSYWSRFLVTSESRYVLVNNDPEHNAIAWLSSQAQTEMVNVAVSALGMPSNPIKPTATFSEIFNCNPADEYYGYSSWDDFFTRTFCDGVRPVSSPDDDNVIVNACESAPLALKHGVKLSDTFWLKNQPYSLENMLNWDEFTPQFVGGTVYQAFLSALSYHRWHSPVSGTIVKAYVVNGSYYLENLDQGFYSKKGPDSAGPNNSQAFITATATRAIIFIQADNPAIGLMCIMPVGMAEVSSCEITVKPGQHVSKGEQLGMFHFGGSTHCLFFRPEVNLAFTPYENPGLDAPNNICVNTQLALVQQTETKSQP